MEGFMLNIIATVGFSGVFLVIFFSIYYLYLRGNAKDKERDMNKSKNKKLGKRILK